MRNVIMLFVLLLIVGCGERVQEAPKAGERVQLPPIVWVVVDQETLNVERRKFDPPVKDGAQVQGFTYFHPVEGVQYVYTLPPKFVDDTVTRTLGHEVLHVAIGDYHKERH